MQLTINSSDSVSDEKMSFYIQKLKDMFSQEGISVEVKKEAISDDPWDNLNLEEMAVDTCIEDLAKNHDHYLYGTPKIK
jgi:hypothetical protein